MSEKTVYETVESERELLYDLAERLWETPELGLHEHESAEALATTLREEGFDVEMDVAGMPTAFVATYGEGDPTIGILGEYDALPGLSQEVKAERSPIERGGPGHGCGHNLFGTATLGAAVAVKRAIEDGELQGTIRYYGCPAEETLVGKTYMARAGVFDDLDAALTWHPGDLNTPRVGSSNALNSLLFEFEGESAHAGGSPDSGRSALDAVELTNVGVEFMREHVSDDARLHYSIPDGGDAPNVVPAEASVWYFVRAPTREEVERNTDWLRDIAQGAATMTQTEVSERFLSGCHDYLANGPVTDAIWENMEAVGPIDYDEADHEFARELLETVDESSRESRLEDLPEDLRETVEPHALYSEPVPPFNEDVTSGGSTEVGDVSYITPTGQFNAATWPVGAPGHSWQVVAANGDFGRKGMLFAAKVIAGAAHDLMVDPETLAAARAEFEEATGGEPYETPLPPEAEPPFDMTAE
ncbi:aminobenzoyl-glutamate utilization protein B [Halorubrum aquaticum]|uniref:Aminobenzoyl-glutamate utilization protein B n=1 Tax=Halorubrum aquaticum TaxID=387340 RepID=A0A1I3CQF7_9EURY|nr:amidohydrolase [Halorubrum aquaticum]SFH76459.1 aminobenzoyl-glutamate utilization protein B [Halorubrum aquaticum]